MKAEHMKEKGGMKLPNRKLKALRAEHNLTQKQLAKKIGISVTVYIHKENGKTDFKESEINQILDIFDVKYEDIFMP